MYIRSSEQAETAAARFGADRVTTMIPDVDEFEHVFVATPAVAVPEILTQVGSAHRATNLLLVQKGALDPSVFRTRGWKGVFYLTGAAVSASLMADEVVGMVLASWVLSSDVHELVHSVTTFRAVHWDNPCDILCLNQLRTVGSIQRGMADQALSSRPSTRSLAISSIEAEGKQIARLLGRERLVDSNLAQPVRVRRVLTADEDLCSSAKSRNYDFGHLVGGGCLPLDAQHIVEEAKGIVEGIGSVQYLARQFRDHLDELPYLCNTALVLEGRRTIAQAMEDLQEGRDNWL